MGIFDLLSKEGRDKKALEKNIKTANDKRLKSAEDRMPALEKLREIGSDEAIYGLCRRFGFVYDKSQEDEYEKRWVEDALIDFGEKALPPLRRFILAGESLSYPLRVLEKIATPPRVLEIIDELMAREEPGYTRHPEKKIQLVTWLGEWRQAEAAEISRRIVPYLKDFDETVRFTSIDALAHARKDEATTREPLIEALIRPEEESRRVLVRIAEVLAERGWAAPGEAVAKLVAAKLPEFSIDKDGKLLRKPRAG